MNIYTKSGDNGTTGLVGGTRISKDDIRLEAYGSIDELNAFIGILCTENIEPHDNAFIQKIQHQLFKIGSYLATDQSATELKFPVPATDEMIQAIESEIDNIVSLLPELHRFIVPGGNRTAAICHICRTVCRRTERNVVKVSKAFLVHQNIICFLNRLSDYFFVLGRKSCLSDGPEIFWDNTK